MKKDINLLEGLNESEKKGNSSTTTILIVVGIVAIIAVMVFMYVSTTNANKDKQAEISKLDQQIALGPTIQIKQAEYDALQATFVTMTQEALKDLNSGKTPAASAKISTNLFKVIYDNYILRLSPGVDANGQSVAPVLIEGITISKDGVMTIACKVKRTKDAWAFAEYLEGTLVVPKYEGAVVPEPVKPTEPKEPVPPVLPENPTPQQQQDFDAAKAQYDLDKAQYDIDKPKYDADLEQYKADLLKYNQYLGDAALSDLYENHRELITNNKKYFSNMVWPGLGPEGDGAEYDMDLSLQFNVNLEELAK